MNIATREIIIPKLRRYFATQPIERVWLFGSFSRGEETETSDVDLLVDFNKAEIEDYFTNFFDLKYALQKLFGRNVDLVEEQTIKNPYLKLSIDASKTLVYGYSN